MQKEEEEKGVETIMGMFDYVEFKCKCPSCGKKLNDFQTKNGRRVMDNLDFKTASNFYCPCDCGLWIEFTRKPAKSIKEFKIEVFRGEIPKPKWINKLEKELSKT